MTAERIDDAQLDALEAVLRRASGLALSPGMRRALPGAVRDAASAVRSAPAELVRRILEGEPDAVMALVERTVVGETFFWRHPEQIALLAELAFGADGPLYLWSAGCASGEEPYSLAMALLEAGRAGRGDRILATDVSARGLSRARSATYGARPLRRLPERLRARYLSGEPPGAEVVAEARRLVSFSRNNLVADSPPSGPFDVVVCRNVLIYFDPVLAAEVLYRLVGATRPGGILVLGPVELPIAQQVGLEWVDSGGASVLRRPLRGP
ncbi:MAG TPA: CheR family methyltransferase [Anaeromyxobacteraceae bacterium]|nr:CheR family methyltransferase [Anaeromyxobacteraceae bacterium]